jgi:hypothetical protein
MPLSSAFLRPRACVLRALFVLCAALPALAQTSSVPARGGMPPIIHRELFFGNPEIPPYWEAGRKMFYVRMGDPTTAEGKKQLERQSPLNSAAKIRTPLLVVQGANDPRVKKAESDQIVIALRDRGFPVEYLVAPDEGHGFARPVNNMAMFATIEKFLAKHLGGRYQESMPDAVSTRLKEITVDPKSHRAGRHVQGVQGRGLVGRRGARRLDDLDRRRYAAGGQDRSHAAADGRSQADL